jgi:SAM-dependent methyltransferase
MIASPVLWHDLECGGYSEDLPLWRELAGLAKEPVLDVGAGTGRVTLDLVAHGHEVVALDHDPELLAALEERAGVSRPLTVCADARSFELRPRTFGLVIVPMQTIQLLGGAAGRAAFLERALEHLDRGGLLVAAIADALEGYDADHATPPLPDTRELDGVVYASHPLAVRDEGDQLAIERLRETVAVDGTRTTAANVIRLDRLDDAMLAREGEAIGFEALAPRFIDATNEYVGSVVVVLRA